MGGIFCLHVSTLVLLCFSNILPQNLANCHWCPATQVKFPATEGRLTLKMIKNGRKKIVLEEDHLKAAGSMFMSASESV